MRSLVLALALSLTIGALHATPAVFASHSAGGGTTAAGCGTLVIDNVAELTKGRTDGIVISVDHTVGCKHLTLKQLSPAGIGEAQGNSWQMRNCVEEGQFETAMTFEFYFDTKIDPGSVKVSCSPYRGDD